MHGRKREVPILSKAEIAENSKKLSKYCKLVQNCLEMVLFFHLRVFMPAEEPNFLITGP